MLIRRQDAAMQALRPFAVPLSPAQASRIRGERLAERADDTEPADAHEAELARLQAQVEWLEAALDDAKSAREAAVEAALEQGREEGLRAADELGTERLETLRDQLARTSEKCLQKLTEKDDLAIEIARTAIHKILGEASPCAALAGEIVRNAMAQVVAGTIVAVRVSSKDFAADDELALLARELGAVRIVCDEELPCGGCEIELTLGTVVASLDVQLGALDRELGRFANETS